MNKTVAEKLAQNLKGKQVGGWSIRDLINHGKSAAVFLAERGGVQGALKIFDPEIVDRYGHDSQLKRIEREKSLIGKTHPNLINIYDGGEADGFLYIAMEYFPGPNLEEKLTAIPKTEIRSLVSQIASAAKFLEECSFAHRDIKPSNIGISNDLKSVKLLDFGVIRPLNLSNITDQGQQHFFVATLRYSPPELLFREELQTLEAWRAITFYQLGAVIHDLLMKKQLFGDITDPYARLVRAVEREIPIVDAPDADADLRLLAQNCLAKDPTLRLSTVEWGDFARPKIADPMESARRRIAQRRLVAEQKQQTPKENADDLSRLQTYAMKTAIHSAVVNTIKAEGMPRYSNQVMSDANPYLLRVLFEPSSQEGADHYFCFYCLGWVTDPNSQWQRLELCACVTNAREAVPAEPDSKAPRFKIEGALIDQDIRTNVQQRLLLAYAESLDASIGESTVFWLNIEGTL